MTYPPRQAATTGLTIMAVVATLGCAAVRATAQAQPAVTTYHNDTSRTGWNPAETALTAASVRGLQLQHPVVLDEQVDAQPLYVPDQTISGQGAHEVVYAVTEANTVYAVDASTGAILLSVREVLLDPRLEGRPHVDAGVGHRLAGASRLTPLPSSKPAHGSSLPVYEQRRLLLCYAFERLRGHKTRASLVYCKDGSRKERHPNRSPSRNGWCMRPSRP